MSDDSNALLWIAGAGGSVLWRRPQPLRRRTVETIWTCLIASAIGLELYAKATGEPTLSQMVWHWQSCCPLLRFWLAAMLVHWFAN